jgi:hypothetical protein
VSEYIEAYIDLTDASPDVDRGLRNKEGAYDCVRITHRNVMIRLSPSTIAKAFATLCENGMKESYLDADAIKTIREYLDD